MAKTFYSESEYFSNIEEPMFTRSRKTYKGDRPSAEENLEINSLIVNFYILNLTNKQFMIC